MELRKAKQEEYKTILDLLNQIFVEDEDVKDEAYDSHFFQMQVPKLYRTDETIKDHWVIEDQGKIAAIGTIVVYAMHIGHEVFRVCGVGSIGVVKEYRSQGLMKILMNQLLEQIQEEKADFAVLGGNRQRYEYYGFYPASMVTTFHFMERNGKHVLGANQPVKYQFQEVTELSSSNMEQIEALHQAKTIYVERESSRLIDILKTWKSRVVLVSKDGEFAGYLVSSESRVYLNEIEAVYEEDLIQILYDYVRTYSLYDIYVCNVAQLDSVKSWLLYQYAESASITANEKLRVFTYERLIRSLLVIKGKKDRLCDGHFVLQIGDREKLFLSVNGDKIVVEQTSKQAEVVLSGSEAIQFLFGLPMCGYGSRFPAVVSSWFPLPFYYPTLDEI